MANIDCSLLADCGDCTSSKCFWNPSERKCDKEKLDGYSDNCTLAAFDKFNAAMQYKGQNIKSADGRVAYVTSSGILKEYRSENAETATMGKHGCPVQIEPVNQLWEKMGFALGSAMATGQACGNEATYITAAPPENGFDEKWYRAKYGLTSDKDAYSDWVDTGAKEGRLPNESILASMQQIGKVGYVDTDAVLHPINDGVRSSAFQGFEKRSNVRGTQMQDCLKKHFVTYGGSVLLVHPEMKALRLKPNREGTFATNNGSTETMLFVRPFNANIRDGTNVRYGDGVYLSTSSASSSTCGLWGCKVAKIDPITLKLTFQSGGDPFIIVPTSQSYNFGTNLEIGFPFFLLAVIPVLETAIFGGNKKIRVGTSITSENKQFTFVYLSTGHAALYRDDVELWRSSKGDPLPNFMRFNTVGQLELVNRSGIVYWRSPTIQGQPPFQLRVTNHGTVEIFDNTALQNKNPVALYKVGNTSAIPSQNARFVIAGKVDEQGALYFKYDDPMKIIPFTFGLKTPPETKCDVKELQTNCMKDPECKGFILDASRNAFQDIRPGTSYMIGESPTDVYVKVPALYEDAADPLCPSSKVPAFVDATTFSNYREGKAFSFGDKEMCTPTKILDQLDKEVKVEGFSGNMTLTKLQEDLEILRLQARVRATAWLLLALVLLICFAVWFRAPAKPAS